MGSKKRERTFFVYAALWGVPGFITMLEAYRLSKLAEFQSTTFAEGPVGYMFAVGLLLIGFCIWEIAVGLRPRAGATHSNAKTGGRPLMRVYLTIAYMVLFLVFTPILGFILASGCFLVACLLLLGCTVIVSVVTALVYCVTLHGMLPYLGLSLPRGILGF
jgi:hypothetical protein